MSRVKISQLTELTTPDSNTKNTFILVTDVQSGTAVSKRMSVFTLDTLIDVSQGQANSAFFQANGAFVHANSGFIQANASFAHANAAYLSQNATGQYTNSAFGHANSSFIHANAAFNAPLSVSS
jgi:hypothetical protein